MAVITISEQTSPSNPAAGSQSLFIDSTSHKLVARNSAGTEVTMINTSTEAAADGATKGIAAFTANDFDAAAGVISLDYANGQKASTSQPGFLTEIAIASEVNSGSDATRAISPDAFAGSNFGIRLVQINAIEAATALSNGDGKAYFFVPLELNGMNLVSVAAMVDTVSSSGTPTVQIRNVTDSQDMLSTLITIDINEKTSYTAATPAVIDATKDDVATGDQLAIDLDVSGTGTKGLWVNLGFQLP